MNKLTLCICTILVIFAAAASAQDILKPPTSVWCELWDTCRVPPRVIPDDPRPYRLPRSVGATTVIPDLSEGPLPWWSSNVDTAPGKRAFSETVSLMTLEGVTAIGALLRAHPTVNYYENIRRAFRNPDVDILVITPLHWSSWERSCVGNSVWLNFPPVDHVLPNFFSDYPNDIFEMLYQMYANQDKVIIVSTIEADWAVHGTGCRGREECVIENYQWCMDACEDGTLVPYDGVSDASCLATCCDMYKMDRETYFLTHWLNNWQLAASAARARHPNAALRVFFSVEVNFFGTQEWQFRTVVKDVIPRMVEPPDFIGLSLYSMAGDVDDALDYVLEHTRLPVYRVFVSEVGAREGTQPDGSVITGTPQYDRITDVVHRMFARGVQLVIVWSYEERAWTGGHTGFAVIDPVTGKRLSGWAAIQELNEMYRSNDE